jgi:uncharacterized protein YcbX
MSIVGRVESLWRYPVKSMRGEELPLAFLGFSGLYGDRLYAFRSSAAPKGFPYLTAREQPRMLQCRAVFRHPDRMVAPLNLAAAQALAPGVTPLYAGPEDLGVDVESPSLGRVGIEDPRLIELLSEGKREGLQLALLRSERALTDCRPVSLISLQTTRQLSDEVGMALDKRRFRANVYVDLANGSGFGEVGWVGCRLRIGEKVELSVLEHDPRCKMITLDPETSQATPEVIRKVTADHGGNAGVYAAVLVEGLAKTGDEITIDRP